MMPLHSVLVVGLLALEQAYDAPSSLQPSNQSTKRDGLAQSPQSSAIVNGTSQSDGPPAIAQLAAPTPKPLTPDVDMDEQGHRVSQQSGAAQPTASQPTANHQADAAPAAQADAATPWSAADAEEQPAANGVGGDPLNAPVPATGSDRTGQGQIRWR